MCPDYTLRFTGALARRPVECASRQGCISPCHLSPSATASLQLMTCGCCVVTAVGCGRPSAVCGSGSPAAHGHVDEVVLFFVCVTVAFTHRNDMLVLCNNDLNKV